MHFRDGENIVSDTHIVLNKKTYSIDNISYVTVTKISPKRGCSIPLLIFSFIFLIYCLDVGSGVDLIFGLPITLGLFFWIIYKKAAYVVRLGLGMGEVHAFKSNNYDLVDQLHNAIKVAMRERDSKVTSEA